MPPRTLGGLDRDVYQIIRKFEDQHAEDKKPPRFTVSGVYDAIKQSNSSLSRQKKRPLEDSIERVLRLRREEKQEDDEEAHIEKAMAAESPKPKERDYYLLNKQIAKSWNLPKAQPAQPAQPVQPVQPAQPAQPPEMASLEPERLSNGEPKPKRRKAESKEKDDRSPPTDTSLEDLGGMDAAIEVLVKSITWPMNAREACEEGLVKPARGVLIHGPPGCGKTMLAKAYAASLGVAFIPVSAPSLVAGMSGESEKKIRELYDEAKKLAPCLIFIDEIDAIMGKRENAQREMEKRIVAQMLTCMDDCDAQKLGGKLVVTLAATNRPDSIDPALRRAGRFNYEISLGIPNEAAREAILRKMLSKIPLAGDVDYKMLAKRTPGFVGADLEDLISVAQNDLAATLMTEISQSSDMDIDVDLPAEKSAIIKLHNAIRAAPLNAIPKDKYTLSMHHFLEAVKQVQPASKREGFSTIPDTTWAHIGALSHVQEELMLSIVQPIHHPERFKALGIDGPSGVLLWGPPGCGKTLLAKAVANESKANFISVKGPELLNKYVGESERSVRQVFSRARASAPCIVFFDELDALVPRRDANGTDSSARVVNQLLTEMDGMNSRSGVYVIGATNRPDMIDPAILRPGRLGTNIFIDLPNADGRADILKTRIRRVLPSYTDFDVLDSVARDRRCDGFSGADIENLHSAAAKAAMRRMIQLGQQDGGAILPEDWQRALNETKPSVSESHSEKFRQLKELGWE
ncbi:putative AAA family ATPase 60S ribosome export protein [Rosellinia necatrix]|uniref:Peroxisomal ATPase PEX1 n=1 Tax=Rosellinia necatrix TaxID=77044 RepID=A0A1W2TL31_ROSNE|nr:putative AAA family ATPase 60S ribosome export protein [Rosellinia necatrix]